MSKAPTALLARYASSMRHGPWTCRPASEGDEPLLRAVLATSKAIELALLGPDSVLREAFIGLQMRAQRHSVERHYPGAREFVLMHLDQAAGRLWLHEDDEGLRLIDITVLPAFQRLGGARTCLQALIRLADLYGRSTHLHVLADNPIRHWYARLGFDLTGSAGLHQAMTRLPTILESHHEQA